MQREPVPSNPWPGPLRLALSLVLASAIVSVEPSPVRAGGLPPRFDLASISATQPGDAALVPTPATTYALEMTSPNSFPSLGGGLSEGVRDASADGSYFKSQSQSSAPESANVIVESMIYILSSNDQADLKFNDLQASKRKETGATPRGVSNWPADRVSTYYAANGPSDGVAGGVLRYRNAIGLVEIRGGRQHATPQNAKTLLRRVLQAFQQAT
jgi:hypothetical protein